ASTAALNKLQKQVGDSLTGMVSAFAMNAAPPGWLKCNGAVVSRTAFAGLFARIGVVFGEGDGSTTFGLPDLRGLFLRGLDDGRGLDPARVFGTFQDMMIHAHGHTASAAAVGDHGHTAWTDAQGNHVHSAWTDAQGNHDHGWRIAATGQGISVGYPSGGGNIVDLEMPGGKNADNQPMRTDYQGNHAHNVGIGAAGQHAHNVGVSAGGAHTHGITVAAAGGTETRPKNMALLFCIKY
ncbi:phage tail protein, partial [Pseudomonas sp. RA_105y_Pfl2_P56]|uniref:phage tail protein n=1 Tax=Pseudomonas sp. RA_105y_Pfl2_P56 TaxID=3088701 RepID=UPI0030DAB7C1